MGAYFCMGAYKCNVVVVIKMGAYIHGVLILCGCLLSGNLSDSSEQPLLATALSHSSSISAQHL